MMVWSRKQFQEQALKKCPVRSVLPINRLGIRISIVLESSCSNFGRAAIIKKHTWQRRLHFALWEKSAIFILGYSERKWRKSVSVREPKV
jgi:hypothetical protein